MKKLILISLAILFCTLQVHSFIPVFDYPANVQRIINLAQTIAKWNSYISKFKAYTTQYEAYKNAFNSAYRGFAKINDLDDLLVNIGNLKRFMTVMYSTREYETYASILMGSGTLQEKYPDIENYDHIYSNQYYQVPDVKAYFDETITDAKERMDNANDLLQLFKTYRGQEVELLENIEKIQNQIKKYSLEGGGEAENGETTGEFAKVAVSNAAIRLQSLIAEVETVTMLRLVMENLIKEKVYEMNENMRRSRFESKGIENVERLYNAVK